MRLAKQTNKSESEELCCHDANHRYCKNLKLKPRQSTLRYAPWWSTPNLTNLGLGLVLVLLFIVVTVHFYNNWRSFSPEADEAANIYIDGFRAIAVLVGFYLLALGIQVRENTEIINSFHENSSNIEGLMLEFYPASLRLYKSLYGTDPYLQATAIPPEVDLQERNYIEICLCSLLFISIDNSVTFTPLADQGFIQTWRSWFKSPIVREQWPSNRAFFEDSTVRFVEQNLFPDSPMPQPSAWRLITDNQLNLILFIITIIWFLFTVLYWTFWWFPPMGLMWGLYWKILESIFIGALVLLLVYDINRSTTLALINFNSADVIEIQETFLDSYPNGVLLYQQMYQDNCRLQEIRPRGVNLNEQLMECSALAGILFQSIESVLKLQTVPDESFVRQWRSWFHSCILYTIWPANRQFFENSTILFVDRNLLPKCSPCCVVQNEHTNEIERGVSLTAQTSVENKSFEHWTKGKTCEQQCPLSSTTSLPCINYNLVQNRVKTIYKAAADAVKETEDEPDENIQSTDNLGNNLFM